MKQVRLKRRVRSQLALGRIEPLTQFVQPRRLIIFDVDGTLIDAHPVDNDSYDDAFHHATGRRLTADMWEKFTEVTAVAIIHQALGAGWPDIASVEIAIRDGFLSRLRAAHDLDASCIRPFAGALNLFENLCRHDNFEVAIATGCWRETAHFKLTATGFPFVTTAFACASDQHRRAEIVRLAAERAGVPLENAVYVGDGEWDLRATRELAIPFIGVGKRIVELRQAGATYILEEFSMNALLRIIAEIEAATARQL